MRTAPSPPHYLYPRLVRAKQLIDEGYHRPLRLDDVAAEACLSPFHFLRLFKKVYRHTPHQYLVRIRLEKARSLLAQTDKTLDEICQEVGFESLGSFATLFKRKMGRTPADYRRKAQKHLAVSREAPAQVIPHCFIRQFAGESPGTDPQF